MWVCISQSVKWKYFINKIYHCHKEKAYFSLLYYKNFLN